VNFKRKNNVIFIQIESYGNDDKIGKWQSSNKSFDRAVKLKEIRRNRCL